MMWWTKLTYLLVVAVAMTAGQAPGDEQELCTVSLPELDQNIVEDPPNGVVLMDSSHYQRLLAPNTNPVWQKVDRDTNNDIVGLQSNWIEEGASCVSQVTVCGWTAGDQDNWLITQHINRRVDGGLLQEVSVMIEYRQSTCPEETTAENTRCRRTFELLKYETSTIDREAARDTNNYQSIRTLTTQVSGARTEVTESFTLATSESGFYLAIRDPGTCIIISRLVVFYYACPGETVNLVVRPETIAPTIASTDQLSVIPTCVQDSSLGGNDISLKCFPRGVWVPAPSSACQCDAGFIPTMNQTCLSCEAGFYASVVNGECLTCPNNSNSTQSGLAACPCDQGYYRTHEEADLPCTLPPSPPLNVRVVAISITMVTVQWEEPVSTGGRSREELRYNLWYRPVGGSQIALSSTVTTTTGTVQGLSASVEYEVFVTSETNITAQIPTNEASLLARGNSRIVTTLLQNTEQPIVTTVLQNTEQLIVPVVVSVLVVVIALVALTTVILVAVTCYKKRVAKMTVELTELKTVQESVMTETQNPSYGCVAATTGDEPAESNYEEIPAESDYEVVV